MKIRPYKTEDSVNVRDLILSILEKEYPFDKSAYNDTDINDITGTYSGEESAFFVIEDKGQIAGSVGVKKDADDTALVRRLFVGEDYRRKGYGSMLLKKAVDFCKEKSYKKIVFRATDRMKEAMALCKKTGFVEKEDLEVSGFHIHKFLLEL